MAYDANNARVRLEWDRRETGLTPTGTGDSDEEGCGWSEAGARLGIDWGEAGVRLA